MYYLANAKYDSEQQLTPDDGWEITQADKLHYIKPLMADLSDPMRDTPEQAKFLALLGAWLQETTDACRVVLHNAALDAAENEDPYYLDEARHEQAIEQYSNHLQFRIKVSNYILENFERDLEDMALVH